MSGLLVLLMGRSFSGKSTVASKIASTLGGSVLSFDALNEERGLRSGDDIPVEEWVKTGRIAHERARVLLGYDATVVVDDTSSPRFLRDEWRDLASDSDADFRLVHVDPGLEAIRHRHAANRMTGGRHDVLDQIMETHLAVFEPPQEDEEHLQVAGAADLTEQQIRNLRVQRRA